MSGLGGRPRNRWLADIVTFSSPSAARLAAAKMVHLYRTAKDMRGRVLIVRSADLAYRRAKAKGLTSIAEPYGRIARSYKNQVDMHAPRSNPKISKSYFRGGVR